MNEDLFIKKLKQANDKYFEKHFLNQDINTAISETMLEGLKILLKAYTKFAFLENSIYTIKSNKKFWKDLNIETKTTVKLVLKGVKKLTKLYKIFCFRLVKEWKWEKIFNIKKVAKKSKSETLPTIVNFSQAQ